MVYHPITRYIGAISYPVYLYDIWAIGLAKRSGVRKLRLAVGLTVLSAAISYHFVEKPFLKLKGGRNIPSETGSRGTAPANNR